MKVKKLRNRSGISAIFANLNHLFEGLDMIELSSEELDRWGDLVGVKRTKLSTNIEPTHLKKTEYRKRLLRATGIPIWEESDLYFRKRIFEARE